MANSVNPDETAQQAVSSGSRLFAQVPVLACRTEKDKALLVCAGVILQCFISRHEQTHLCAVFPNDLPFRLFYECVFVTIHDLVIRDWQLNMILFIN